MATDALEPFEDASPVALEQGGQLLLHVPLKVIAHHAEKHMGFDPRIQLVIGGANLQGHRLELSKAAVDERQLSVGADRLGLIEHGRRRIGANDVTAVQRLFLLNSGFVDAPLEFSLGHAPRKEFPHVPLGQGHAHRGPQLFGGSLFAAAGQGF